jgi:hypothetical protein
MKIALPPAARKIDDPATVEHVEAVVSQFRLKYPANTA